MNETVHMTAMGCDGTGRDSDFVMFSDFHRDLIDELSIPLSKI